MIFSLKTKKVFSFFLFTLLIFKSFALDPALVGSEMYSENKEGTISFADSVSFARDPNKSNDNLWFSNSEYVQEMPTADYVYGPGEKFFQASALNFKANMHRTAARVDPRTPNFINEGLTKTVKAFAGPDASKELTKLQGTQSGDPELRYIEAGLIEPSAGLYQTADNQQAFISAQDNVILGQAEQALFEGDELSAIAYFDKKASDYKKGQSKQITATSFQKDGIMRSKKTAETFRDFFEFKRAATQKNLDYMPTEQGLVANCQNQSSPQDNQYGVYNHVMSQEDIQLYGFSKPSYNFDWCESYVHGNSSYLLRNNHVHTQLKSIADDSEKMANALDDISRFLSKKGLSLEQIDEYLKNNEAWKNLANRGKAYKKCAKTKCLDGPENAFAKNFQYPDFQLDIGTKGRKIRSLAFIIRETKKLPDELKGPRYESNKNSRQARRKKLSYSSGSLSSKSSFRKEGSFKKTHLKSGKAYLVKEKKKGDRTSNQINAPRGINFQKNYALGGLQRYRDDQGVLRGKSGKAIMGFEAPAHVNLFQLISKRYKKKFMNQ